MTKSRRPRVDESRADNTRCSSGGPGPHTLAIDIGGTALKASVLDKHGRMIVERVRIPTPYPCSPKVLLRALAKLAAPLPSFERISIGFPGVVRGGHVVTAPHFGNKAWRGYPLEAAVAQHLERPARLLNHAEVQGLGMIAGRGLEVVLTLGTGIGSAVFLDGWLAPHLELAQHLLHNKVPHRRSRPAADETVLRCHRVVGTEVGLRLVQLARNKVGPGTPGAPQTVAKGHSGPEHAL